MTFKNHLTIVKRSGDLTGDQAYEAYCASDAKNMNVAYPTMHRPVTVRLEIDTASPQDLAIAHQTVLEHMTESAVDVLSQTERDALETSGFKAKEATKAAVFFGIAATMSLVPPAVLNDAADTGNYSFMSAALTAASIHFGIKSSRHTERFCAATNRLRDLYEQERHLLTAIEARRENGLATPQSYRYGSETDLLALT